jgi:hypothetical protein
MAGNDLATPENQKGAEVNRVKELVFPFHVEGIEKTSFSGEHDKRNYWGHP